MSDGEINVDSIDGEVSTSANIVGQLYPQGEKGDKGDPGNDGFSPTVTTEKVGKTTTITITDAQGEHTATILDGQDGQGSGDMLTSVYDTDHNGIVDNAEKVNNHTVGTDVPADAVFTDTTYTAGTGIDITGNVITNTQTSAEWGNITGTLSDQTDLKDALDSKANTSAVPTKVSDLNNDSGFIDKDVNNLTNYDTSTTVDTKISNSEEVLIGSDSGIKASHELWVDTSDVTPYINSEISNIYGTAQNLGYSQAYSNTTFATKDVATTSANGLMSSTDKTNLTNYVDGLVETPLTTNLTTSFNNQADGTMKTYRFQNGATDAPSSTVSGILMSFKSSTDWGWQVAIYNSVVATRQKRLGTWESWNTLVSNNNITFQQQTNWSLNSTYCGSNPGYTFVYKNNTMCIMSINFQITTAPPREAFFMSNLPISKQRFVFSGLVGSTPVRLYVHTDGKLYTDSSNVPTGWLSANITYPLA